MKNKTIKNSLLITAGVFFLVMAILSGCKKDEDTGAMPLIAKVRVVEKDSTITAGKFGLNVAIVGDGLQDVREVWFNDLQAYLNPNFVTKNTIITSVPKELPTTITNKIKLVTGSGAELLYDFKVILPVPEISAMYNEMAAPGGITKILGTSLYFISEVRFGSNAATIIEYKSTEITVKIPAAAKAGDQITVVGEGGTAVSSFKYRDAGLFICDFDKPNTTWGSIFCWGGMMFREDAASISKNYGYIIGTDLPPSSWNNDWVGSTCWFDYGYGAVDYSQKVFKFEINASEPWVWSDALPAADQAELLITIAGKAIHFRPQEMLAYRTSGFSTNGWMTISIPLSSVGIATATLTDFQLVFKTNKQVYSKFNTLIDNFRICTPIVARP